MPKLPTIAWVAIGAVLFLIAAAVANEFFSEATALLPGGER